MLVLSTNRVNDQDQKDSSWKDNVITSSASSLFFSTSQVHWRKKHDCSFSLSPLRATLVLLTKCSFDTKLSPFLRKLEIITKKIEKYIQINSVTNV